MDTGLTQALQSSNIVVDVFISVGGAYLDGIVNVNTFNTCKLKARIFNLFF